MHWIAPVVEPSPRVAVVGAGMAGLAAARTLHDNGYGVTVFDKARGPGGRMATRRNKLAMFDHGAQYFTVSDPVFERIVRSWIDQGIVGEWDARIGVLNGSGSSLKQDGISRFVGTPRMSAITRHLASGLDVSYSSRVEHLRRDEVGWTLKFATETAPAGPFDALVMTPPAEQSTALLKGLSPVADEMATISMAPCWALMAAFKQPLDAGYDAYFINEGPLGWIARNSSKPDRPPTETWVAHATPAWSKTHLEMDRDRVAALLLQELLDAISVHDVDPVHVEAHRWRFARADRTAGSACLWDGACRLAVAGDWVLGSKVEDAYCSGVAAADRIMGSF